MRSRITLVAALAVVAATTSAIEYVHTRSLLEAGEAALAGALAVGLVAYALTLPGLHWRGLMFGGFFAAAGLMSWTFADRPLVIWGFLGVEGVVFAALSYPWLRDLPVLARIGGAWLGVAYWVLGIAGALLMLNLKVSAQRVAYAGVFVLAVLAVVASVRRARPARDLSVGVAATFIVAIAVLVLVGSGNLFDATHVVPASRWGEHMQGRFWGGPGLMYHPNSMAGLGVAAVLRIAPDPLFARWQRLVALVFGGGVLYFTNSRTGFVFAAAAATVHAALLWWRARNGQPATGLGTYRRPWLAAAAPFLVLLAVLMLSGGRGFIFQERYGDSDLTSGRLATWTTVLTEWRDGPVAEKLFGDTKTSRAVVIRADSGLDIQLTTDNAAVGALRRGGVFGVLAFLLGLYLLLRHALRAARDGPAWFPIAVVASLPTIATSDWLLGGTGGTLWILLLVGEVAVAIPSTVDVEPAPSAAPP
jgi:hypothetical protein